ncbi:MAG: ATP-binding protein [Chloroflexi bacterium]|nr:ATP-binding protein [Chloroflexota bacterium]
MKQRNHEVVFRLDIPATFKYLNVVSGSLTAVLEQIDDLPERESLTYNVTLAVHEICANIVEHAYAGEGGRIKMDIHLNERLDRLVVELYDAGEKFDLAAAPEPDLDIAPIRGYGLFLVRQLMDEVSYQPGTGQNHWRLMKRLL